MGFILRSEASHFFLFFFDFGEHFEDVVHKFESEDDIVPDFEMDSQTVHLSFFDLEESFHVGLCFFEI